MTAPERISEPVVRGARPWIGKYRVLGKLGEGGMGAVYAAEDPELDRRVAIKLLHGTSETASARLVREARALAKLRHPNVVTIYEVGRDAGDAFVAMELVKGMTLRDWLRAERSIEERLEVLVQAGRGLAAAHAEGLIHRDFKPENVMVGADGRVQVLDFGLAKSAVEDDDVVPSSGGSGSGSLDSITRTGTVLGTPAYMAPEQFAAAATDARTDQFAYCVSLFEALHGFRPFGGATHAELSQAVASGTLVERQLSSDVPPHVQAAIMRGLAVDAAARFPDMKALLAALHAPPRRRRWILAVLAAAAVLVGGAVWIAANRSPASSSDEQLFARSGVPAPQPAPLAGDPLKVTVHRLSNGLTVFISPNRKSPRVESRLIIRAGSRDANGVGGLAHMVEHMSYKGTPRIGTLDYAAETPHLKKLRELYAAHARATSDADRAKLLEQIDAETVAASRFAMPSELTDTASALGVRRYHASTDHDATTFYADIPSNKFALWAKLEGERLANPVFRAFHVEAGVVFDEIHQRRSTGATQAMIDELVSTLYGNHPYAPSPGGTFADIVAEPFTATEAFHATWYVPNNAALVLAGDISAEQAIPVLERELARWRPRPLPRRDPRPVAPFAAEIRKTMKGMDLPLVVVGWRGVPLGHADEDALLALSVLFDHLAEAHVGRARMQSQTWPLIEAGMVLASAVPVSGRTQEDAIAALEDVIRAAQSGQFSEDTLAAVLLNYKLSQERAYDTNDARLAQMTGAYLAGRGWSYAVERKARVAALTKADLVRVANTYLTKQRVTMTSELGPYQMPAIKPPRITPIEPKAQQTKSPFVAELLAEETVDIPPRFVSEGRDYHLAETPAGPLIAVANTENDHYALRLRWEVGSRQLPILCAAIHALDHAGIGDADAGARRARWFGRAQTAQIGCTPDAVQVEITGVDATFDVGWEDVARWLAGDGITDALWQTAMGEHLEYRMWGRSGETLIDALDRYAAFGATSIYLTGAKSETLRRTSAGEAKGALRTLVSTRRTLAYFGPRAIDAIKLPPSLVVSREPVARTPARIAAVSGTRVITLDTGPNRAVNATIRIALGQLDLARLAHARVFASYLSSSGGGVLWDAFRTTRGITFSGGTASIDEPEGPNDDASLVIHLATTAEQVPKALELALSIVRDPKVQPDQVTLARRRSEEAFRANWIVPRDLAVTIAHWRVRDQITDPRGQMFEHTLRTGEKEVAKLVEGLASAPTYVTISGDVSAIDRARLQKLGTVEQVAPAALFTP
ncbi:MAG: protein kinase [Myxococcota bacterium]|nr:protein kinase [Myxococcota bacterium]